ncbi:MAG: GNAT family N-acetyltransferase [Anaerolineae bacterium]|jgi:RimJ/RimL family protein N-acetyltransferase
MAERPPTAKGGFTIRTATTDDAVLLRALRHEALAAHPEAFAADRDRTEAEPASTWVERIRRNEAEQEGVICVAAAADRLVGMTGLYRGHWPKTQHSANIWGVYVTAAWRGHGIATALVEACIDWARAQRITVVKLGVVTTNTPAIRCYTRCGFSVYGLEPQVLRHDDVFYDELLMARVL